MRNGAARRGVLSPAHAGLALLVLAAACIRDEAPDPATTGVSPEAVAEAKAAATPSDAPPATPPEAEDETVAAAAGAPEASPAPPAAGAPAPPARPVPHIYVALQPGGEGRPVSVVFAIDDARDHTPSDDPAIRLTPENGLCNPQEMRFYEFPPEYAARPVVSEAEQAKGLTPLRLPDYLAFTVTEMMLARGLAAEREETRPQNICTRKLWESLLVAENEELLPAQ